MAYRGLLLRYVIKKCHFFHFSIGEITTTLDDVACFLHLPIRGKLLDHSRIKRDKSQDMMVIYLGVGPMDALMHCENTRGAHSKILYLQKLFEENLELAEETDNDNL